MFRKIVGSIGYSVPPKLGGGRVVEKLNKRPPTRMFGTEER